MSDNHTKTVRLKKPSRVAQDERGRNVWVGRVETVELELMSTMALQRVLTAGDGDARTEIRKLARSGKDGVLARDTATGHYRIISDDELKSFVAASGAADARVHDKPRRTAEVTAEPIIDKARRAAHELSLVSTQILRKIVKATEKKDPPRGYDPYNKN